MARGLSLAISRLAQKKYSQRRNPMEGYPAKLDLPVFRAWDEGI